MARKLILVLLILMQAGCSSLTTPATPPAPSLTPPLPTRTFTSAPTATITLTPTPTPIAFTPDQLAQMSEEEKLAAGAEAAAAYLEGVTVVKAELRGSQYWTYKTELFENEHLEQEERTVVAG
ncbi:MAG: hypothetical protein DPW18_16835, partial [Chloroflexi bacterium]|nr:hypothetical protein [Chloroflexota bacterium]